MKNLIILTIIVMLVTITIVAKANKSRVSPEQAIPVQVSKVIIQQVIAKVPAVGTLYSEQSAVLNSKVDGYVKNIKFENGQTVAKGQVVIELDDASEKASVASTQAAYHFDLLQLQRMQKLVKLHYVTEKNVDDIRSKTAKDKSAMIQAQQDLVRHQIRAPFAGTLTKSLVNIGDYVKSGQALVSIVNNESLKINYQLPESAVTAIHLGQTVIVTTDGAPGQQYQAKVTYISPEVDPVSRNIELQATIDNHNHQLLPGMFVKLAQITQHARNELFVPEQALVVNNKGYSVYRVINHKAVAVAVKIGERQQGLLQITSGLTANDSVITAGSQIVKNNTKVIQG